MSYGKVKDTFWTDKKIKALPDDAKMLALYLLTGPHRNILGCMRVPNGYLVEDLGWSSERLVDAIKILCECRFICRDDDGWTLVLNQLKHDPVKIPNHARAAVAIANTVPTDSVVYQELVPRLTAALEAIDKGSLWHPDAIAIPEPLPEPLPEPEPEPEPTRAARPAAKRYAFEGSVIRLVSKDLDRWRTNFKHLPNIEAVLTSYDAFLANEDDGAKRWFQRTASYLAKKDAEAAQVAKANGGAGPPPDIYHTRVREFRQQTDADQEPIWRRYARDWGPAPDEPGCRAPVEILKEFGFEPVQADFLKRGQG